MSDRVRAFIAIQLPPQAKEALGGLIELIRRAASGSIRPVPPEGVHLTLKFLGAVPAAQVDAISDRMADVVRAHSPFSLALSGAGVFPPRGSPRVLWVGIDGDLFRLRNLHRDVQGAMAGLGFLEESRAFSPHLTLARVRDGARRDDVRRGVDALLSADVPSDVRIEVDAVALMRSNLRPDGASYECMAEFPLSVENRTTPG